ncbi:MAG TPA: DUF2892 domain-containing protein [Ktedonobacterales bacterium]|jgi:hypothetical protein|nr:DUF2892 domain-containing protein [Ktedonobacterales bacterium]
MGFVSFMASPAGRIARILAGLALIGGGIALIWSSANTALGVVLAVVGLAPLVAGAFDFCLLAPLFGAPLFGTEIRARQQARLQ